jgi:hypothetical protein
LPRDKCGLDEKHDSVIDIFRGAGSVERRAADEILREFGRVTIE